LRWLRYVFDVYYSVHCGSFAVCLTLVLVKLSIIHTCIGLIIYSYLCFVHDFFLLLYFIVFSPCVFFSKPLVSKSFFLRFQFLVS
jgi:hypothetical protein